MRGSMRRLYIRAGILISVNKLALEPGDIQKDILVMRLFPIAAY